MSEWVSLKSTLHSIQEKRFNCASCLSSFSGRRDEAEMLLRKREQFACWGGDTHRHTIADDSGRLLNFTTCIGNWTSDYWGFWIDAHEQFKLGNLPFPNSLADQPNKAMEIFRVIDAFQISVQNERIRKQQEAQNALRKTRGR